MEKILKSVGIRDFLGKKCYCALRNRDTPCEGCFVDPSSDDDNTVSTEEVYLEFLSKYFSVTSHCVEWRGVPAYVIYLSDISREKKANNDITQICENIPGAVFRCRFDKDWTVISMSEGLFSFLGYTREEFAAMGNKLSAVIHPKDFPDILPSITAQIKSGKSITEHRQRFVCKDGCIKWAFIRSQLLSNEEEGEFFYCVLVDISEQKRAQSELDKTQQKLSAAIDHAGLAYWEYDIANRCAYLNAISTSEYSLDNVLENYPESLYRSGAICPDSIDLYDSLVRSVRRGEPTAKADIKTVDANGNIVWKRVRFTTLFDENNQPFWAIATAESIDDYKSLESRFTTVLEQNHIDTWMYDIINRTIIQNHNTEDIYGLHGSEIPNIPEFLIEKEQCHPEDIEIFRDFYRRLHMGESVVTATVRLCDIRTNSYVWKRCTYTVLPSRDGKPHYAIGSAVDVSDQMETKKKYEEAMKYRYRTLGENVILAGHCNVSQNVILEVVDKTGLDIEHRFGMVREDFFKGIASMIPNREQQQTFCKTFLNENMKNSFDLGITQHDYDCTICLGDSRDIRWISTHIDTALQPETNELIGFLTVTDISPGKMQEQVLDSVIRFDYDFVAHLNLGSNTAVFYNSEKRDTHPDKYEYGAPYCYTDAIRFTAEQDVSDGDRDLYINSMSTENVAQQLENRDSFEFTYHLKENGGDLRTKKMRFVVYDRSAGIVIFSRADVTDMLVQQENQKIALAESLALAQQANSSKSKFLASMSHDIRTPMNAIVGMCNLAISDEHNFQQVHESLQVISQSSALLLSMITDILDMNRIESGKTVLTSEVFSFSEQLSLTLERAKALAVKKHQHVERSVDIKHDTCTGDIVRIHRVIDNILANAIKFTPEGGTIKYHLCETGIKNKNIGMYHFEITDTGIGISPEQIRHIFEPFYRVQNSMTSHVEGTGLGLSIVKSIVDYMGGTISVHSAIGMGTSFIIDFPLRFTQNVPSKKKEENPISPSSNLSGKHVLLCEDHPMNQLVQPEF